MSFKLFEAFILVRKIILFSLRYRCIMQPDKPELTVRASVFISSLLGLLSVLVSSNYSSLFFDQCSFRRSVFFVVCGMLFPSLNYTEAELNRNSMEKYQTYFLSRSRCPYRCLLEHNSKSLSSLAKVQHSETFSSVMISDQDHQGKNFKSVLFF